MKIQFDSVILDGCLFVNSPKKVAYNVRKNGIKVQRATGKGDVGVRYFRNEDTMIITIHINHKRVLATIQFILFKSVDFAKLMSCNDAYVDGFKQIIKNGYDLLVNKSLEDVEEV